MKVGKESFAIAPRWRIGTLGIDVMLEAPSQEGKSKLYSKGAIRVIPREAMLNIQSVRSDL